MALLARTAQKVAFAGAQRQFVARPTVALRAAAPEIAPSDDAQECKFACVPQIIVNSRLAHSDHARA